MRFDVHILPYNVYSVFSSHILFALIYFPVIAMNVFVYMKILGNDI